MKGQLQSWRHFVMLKFESIWTPLHYVCVCVCMCVCVCVCGWLSLHVNHLCCMCVWGGRTVSTELPPQQYVCVWLAISTGLPPLQCVYVCVCGGGLSRQAYHLCRVYMCVWRAVSTGQPPLQCVYVAGCLDRSTTIQCVCVWGGGAVSTGLPPLQCVGVYAGGGGCLYRANTPVRTYIDVR